MAEPLDDMLEPGEQVLGRWRGGWLPDAWPVFLMLSVPLLTPLVALVLAGEPWEFLLL